MEERMQVLNLLEEGKINVDEAVLLFKALDEQGCPDEDECPETAQRAEEGKEGEKGEEPEEPEDGK